MRTIGQEEIDALRTALVEGCGSDLDLDGVRRTRVVDFVTPKPLSQATIVQSWQLQTSDGQTIYITKLGRKTKDQASRKTEPSVQRTAAKTVTVTAAGVKLGVNDINRMTEFYERVLGLYPSKRTPRFVSFGSLSLVEAKYASELSGGAVAAVAEPGRHRVVIHVHELIAVFERVNADGKVVQPITTMPWGERVFHCRDPEGNVVEVAEQKK